MNLLEYPLQVNPSKFLHSIYTVESSIHLPQENQEKLWLISKPPTQLEMQNHCLKFQQKTYMAIAFHLQGNYMYNNFLYNSPYNYNNYFQKK